MSAMTEQKVVISAAVDLETREELQRLARRGDRMLSQEVRRALAAHVRAHTDTDEEDET